MMCVIVIVLKLNRTDEATIEKAEVKAVKVLIPCISSSEQQRLVSGWFAVCI